MPPEETQKRIKVLIKDFAERVNDREIIADVLLLSALKANLTQEQLEGITIKQLIGVSTHFRNHLLDA